MIDLKPPSPSLSPQSRINYYHQQLYQAHEYIDQLEITLHEKQQNQKPLLSTPLQNSKSGSFVNTPPISTPKNRMSNSHKQILEIKNRHSELLQQSQQDSQQYDHKFKEMNDQITELKTDLMFSQERQSKTIQENIQLQQRLQNTTYEIERLSILYDQQAKIRQTLDSKIQTLQNKQHELIIENVDKDDSFQSQESIQPQQEQHLEQITLDQQIQLQSLQQEIAQLENLTLAIQHENVSVKKFDEEIEVDLTSSQIKNSDATDSQPQQKPIKQLKNRGCETCILF